MPTVRRKNQPLISFWLDSALLRAIERARGYKQRSQFIREAIAEKLASMGLSVPERLVHPPPRAKVIQIVGDNNRKIAQPPAEQPPKYRATGRKENEIA